MIHCYTYNNDKNYTPLLSSSTMSEGNSTKNHSTNKMPINDILQSMSSTKKQKISNTNISIQINLNNKQSSNNYFTTASNKTHEKKLHLTISITNIHQYCNIKILS